MLPILSLKSNINKPYYKNNYLSNILDRWKIIFEGKNYIKDLEVNISNIRIPPNFHKDAYYNNIKHGLKLLRKKEVILSPSTFRILDYNMYNDFQKRLLGYSVTKSIQLVLRLNKKSIKNSCIIVYDASDTITFYTICYLATKAKHIILVSNNLNRIVSISDYIISNYGITPIVTNELFNAIKTSDFIISSRKIDVMIEKPIWYMDNMCSPMGKSNIEINNVLYSNPWNIKNLEITPEFLGSILCQMGEKDIEKSLKYNGIVLEKINFHDKEIFF
ncbi:hypothetical protein [Clostridium niameyense]|uniref:hypothetical protein n=1 Tax=Clostridium niameyense TaxID=1622073 RepID=UPI00067ECD62|nr:hypothetical protein [Clostridium niameyense]